MPMTDIIEELGSKYNLPEKQLRALKVLSIKSLTAKKISHETSIPIGRLYEHLNSLVNSGLIEKSKGKPSIYSFEDKEKKIYNFLKNKFDETISKEAAMLALLEKMPREIRLLTTRGEYVNECRRIYNEEKEMCFIERKVSQPYYFYPEDDEDYKKVREVIKRKRKLILDSQSLWKPYKETFFENLSKGKRFLNITNKKSVRNFLYNMKKALGKEKFNKQLKKIIEIVQRKNIDCRLSREEFPYRMIVTKNLVVISFTMPDKIVQLLIRDKETAKQFLEFFESIFRESEPILPFLRSLVNKN